MPVKKADQSFEGDLSEVGSDAGAYGWAATRVAVVTRLPGTSRVLCGALNSMPDLTVVADVPDARGALEQAFVFRPDVIVMEAAADPDNALDLARLVTIRGHPSPPGVLLVADTEEDVLVRAAWRGVRGLIIGRGARDLLVPAVRLVAAKYLVVPLSLSRRVLEDWAPGRLSDDPSHAILNVLTPRERDVLELVARGRSNAQISSELRLTESTVKSYLRRILGKLHVRNRVGVVILARELGLV